MTKPTRDDATAGLAFGVGAYLIWGFLPVFLKALAAVPAPQVLAHRIVWSFVLLVIVVTFARRWSPVRAVISSPRMLGTLAVTAMLVAGNWLLYIWAVNSAHVLEASLGYFINPLVNVALGVAVLGERLRRTQGAAVALAAAGVLVLAVAQGQLPWISLALALSFGFYGLLRKMAPADPLTGLLVETMLLTPLAVGYIALRQTGGVGGMGIDPLTDALLVLSGAVTAVPLLMFAAAGKRLRYATVGLLQYIAPTIQFLLAVFLFNEPLSHAHLLAFGFIWAGLLLYAADLGTAARRPRKAATAADKSFG